MVARGTRAVTPAPHPARAGEATDVPEPPAWMDVVLTDDMQMYRRLAAAVFRGAWHDGLRTDVYGETAREFLAGGGGELGQLWCALLELSSDILVMRTADRVREGKHRVAERLREEGEKAAARAAEKAAAKHCRSERSSADVAPEVRTA